MLVKFDRFKPIEGFGSDVALLDLVNNLSGSSRHLPNGKYEGAW
jgi:hypothetical protein